MSTGKWLKPTGIEHQSRWKDRQLRKASPRETMLRDFLLAKTPYEKREVIKTFNPHYFALGETLDPRPRKEIENESV